MLLMQLPISYMSDLDVHPESSESPWKAIRAPTNFPATFQITDNQALPVV